MFELIEEENNLRIVVRSLLYLIKKHNLKNAKELKKHIYTHNFDEDKFKNMKGSFEKFGEMNILSCIFFYKEKQIPTREKLLMKIRGI